MSKKFKRLSAVILAVVMMLGSTVMASAATMNVYIREWTQGNSSNTYLGTPNLTPDGLSNLAFTVTGVKSNGTYKDALKLAQSQGKVTLGWDEDHPEYLTSLAVKKDGNVIYSKTNNGENKDPIYDGTTMTGATWVGSSWMWYPGNDLKLADTSSYPQTTLAGTKVPSTDEFSLVLSYDTTHFKWGTALGGNN